MTILPCSLHLKVLCFLQYLPPEELPRVGILSLLTQNSAINSQHSTWQKVPSVVVVQSLSCVIREFNGKTLRVGGRTILLIEGIHALNPKLTDQVPASEKFKIFINTITSISLDSHNCIPTSDNRLLRRIVRDFLKGAFTARETISNWPNVRRSEVKWIYPFQEDADVLFNSAYLAEFAVLRTHAERILATVPKNCKEYCEAHRLLMFLHYFVPVSDREIPLNSLMRGFIGGGSF